MRSFAFEKTGHHTTWATVNGYKGTCPWILCHRRPAWLPEHRGICAPDGPAIDGGEPWRIGRVARLRGDLHEDRETAALHRVQGDERKVERPDGREVDGIRRRFACTVSDDTLLPCYTLLAERPLTI